MIIQGANEPIVLVFEDINDLPDPDISISLRNEVRELKHWGVEDLTIEGGGMIYIAPISQYESQSWPEGDVKIEVKWMDHWGNTMFYAKRDHVILWGDATELIPTITEEIIDEDYT